MAKAKSQGASKKNARAAYKSENRYEKNRRKRLERVLKEQPNNEQVRDALKKPSLEYRRYKPKTKYGWVNTRDPDYNPLNVKDFVGPTISPGSWKNLAICFKQAKAAHNAGQYESKKAKPALTQSVLTFLKEETIKENRSEKSPKSNKRRPNRNKKNEHSNKSRRKNNSSEGKQTDGNDGTVGE